MKISKGRLIGDALFLTLGPFAAAQLSMQYPEYTWPIILAFLGARIGVELAIVYRKKLATRPNRVTGEFKIPAAHM